MKLLTMKQGEKLKLGIKVNEGIIDVAKVQEVYQQMELPLTIGEVISGDESVRSNLQEISTIEDVERFLLSEDEIEFAPALTNPQKIICVGLNYRKHADETKAAYPEYPILFNKFNNALSGHKAKVAVPKTTQRLDYEVELGIVIGKRGKYIAEADALDYVFGYCTTNDLSARDLQKRVPQWMTGKSNDGFAPVGPYIVTTDEIPNPNALQLTTRVNGEQHQNSNTADMIFNCEELVSYISQHMTLEPGDLIMTGTPEGVIIGRPMEERVYLQPGDEVTVEVEKLGALTTYFVADEA